MNTNNNSGENLNLKAIGNYTKDAVKNFENKIVDETDYLEKVDKNLNSLKSNKNP